MDDSCAVCAETLEWVAYGACGHREVCSTCVSRLRFICNDTRCCICKAESQVIFFTKALGDYTKKITDFSVFPSHPREGKNGAFWFHKDTAGYFDDSNHFNEIKSMCRLSCSICDNPEEEKGGKFNTIDQLKSHLFHRHKKIMCVLCLEGRRAFVCEQKLYTRTQLDRHIVTGDSEVDGGEMERGGFSGHPICRFCKKRFYGDNELYTHMSTQHYTCHICQRQHPGGRPEYYRSYDDLENHFRLMHFLCENEVCLAKKFVVFVAEPELKRHGALEHGGNMSRSKRNATLQIPTSFRSQRSNEQDSRRRSQRGGRQICSGIEATSEQTTTSAQMSAMSAPEGVFASESSAQTTGLSGSSRYIQALRTNHMNYAPQQESSFPALPGAAINNKHQETLVDTMAARLRQHDSRKHKAAVTNGSSQSSGSWSSSTSFTSLSEFPPVCVTEKNKSPEPSNPEGKYVHTVANSLAEEVLRSALGFDESKYTAFCNLSAEYRQGVIGAAEYLSYVQQFGLSHHVLEIARLCPDPVKQVYLLETYNASIRAGRENGLKIGILASNRSSSSNKDKGKCEEATDRGCNTNSCGASSVWKNGGGQKLVSLSQT